MKSRRVLPGSLSELAEQWRAEAEMIRRRGQEALAAMADSYADELEAALREHDLEALTLREAAEESGYSYSALQKMVTKGELQNVGDRHRPRVRRGDLPRKVRRPEPHFHEPDLAGMILVSRK